MFELVPSACMRAYFEELHFEFTDFQSNINLECAK